VSTNADDVLRFIGDNKVEFVDVRLCDLPGTVQHFTVPAESFGAKVLTDGLMFDGSSIRGFQQIHESDMLLPDPAARSGTGLTATEQRVAGLIARGATTTTPRPRCSSASGPSRPTSPRSTAS